MFKKLFHIKRQTWRILRYDSYRPERSVRLILKLELFFSFSSNFGLKPYRVSTKLVLKLKNRSSKYGTGSSIAPKIPSNTFARKKVFEHVPFTFFSAGSSSSNVIFLFFGAFFFMPNFPPLPPFLSFNFLKRASRSSLITWNAFAASSPSNAENSTFSAPRI